VTKSREIVELQDLLRSCGCDEAVIFAHQQFKILSFCKDKICNALVITFLQHFCMPCLNNPKITSMGANVP